MCHTLLYDVYCVHYSITSVTCAYGRDFTIAVQKQKLSCESMNFLYLYSPNRLQWVPSPLPNKLIVLHNSEPNYDSCTNAT